MFGTQAPAGMMTDATLALWSKITATVPNSVIRLETGSIGGTKANETIVARFEPLGLPHRVEFTTEPDPGSYLNRVDIILDPLDNPLSIAGIGAAAQGLPVLTCASENPAAAVLAGWLQAVGLGELVMDDGSALFAKAVDLASPEARQALAERQTAALNTEQRGGAARRAAHLIEAVCQLLIA